MLSIGGPELHHLYPPYPDNSRFLHCTDENELSRSFVGMQHRPHVSCWYGRSLQSWLWDSAWGQTANSNCCWLFLHFLSVSLEVYSIISVVMTILFCLFLSCVISDPYNNEIPAFFCSFHRSWWWLWVTWWFSMRAISAPLPCSSWKKRRITLSLLQLPQVCGFCLYGQETCSLLVLEDVTWVVCPTQWNYCWWWIVKQHHCYKFEWHGA